MAVPTSKSTFKEYCLRALGKGVIDINVSDDQLDDRVDEALQYFAKYHYDGIERVYLKHQLTTAEIARMRTNETAVLEQIKLIVLLLQIFFNKKITYLYQILYYQ